MEISLQRITLYSCGVLRKTSLTFALLYFGIVTITEVVPFVCFLNDARGSFTPLKITSITGFNLPITTYPDLIASKNNSEQSIPPSTSKTVFLNGALLSNSTNCFVRFSFFLPISTSLYYHFIQNDVLSSQSIPRHES